MPASKAVALLLPALLAGTAVARPPARLVGLWRSEESAAVGSAVAYLAFTEQHTCAQVAKGRIFGMTKWQVVECQWTLDGDRLTMTVTGPASEPGVIGQVQKYAVSFPADNTLTLTVDGHSQTATRASEVPAEFVAKSSRLAAWAPKQSQR
jgi:hypothetical protein